MKVTFYPLGSIDDSKLLFVAIIVRHHGQWALLKHKDRETWEFAGGYREPGESVREAAERELYEETGAEQYTLTELAIYSVQREGQSESFGVLYFCNVQKFGPLPSFEMQERRTFNEIPNQLTYPIIYPAMINEVRKFISL